MTKNNEIDIKLGQQLRKLRESRGLSADQLAENLDISSVLLQRWEYGKKRISAVMLFRLCEALEVDVAEIFAGLAPT